MSRICSKPSGLGLGRSSSAPSSFNGGLAQVVADLCKTCRAGDSPVLRGHGHAALPSRRIIIQLVEELRSVLFPGYFGTSEINGENMEFHVGATLDTLLRGLRDQVVRGLCFVCKAETSELCIDCENRALEITRSFLSCLPRVQRLLSTDVVAAYEGDPAASSPDETVLCYPGILALTNYRLAHELYKLEVPVIPRIITEHAHSTTGIDIHPGATIGESMFIDHGTGVVIGETSVIGKRVRIYQGVTLGAKSFPLDENGNPVKGIRRHPTVEDDVIIYSGATILGTVNIGKGSVIGGNVWLTRSVPPGSRIHQASVRNDRFQFGAGI